MLCSLPHSPCQSRGAWATEARCQMRLRNPRPSAAGPVHGQGCVCTTWRTAVPGVGVMSVWVTLSTQWAWRGGVAAQRAGSLSPGPLRVVILTWRSVSWRCDHRQQRKPASLVDCLATFSHSIYAFLISNNSFEKFLFLT